MVLLGIVPVGMSTTAVLPMTGTMAGGENLRTAGITTEVIGTMIVGESPHGRYRGGVGGSGDEDGDMKVQIYKGKSRLLRPQRWRYRLLAKNGKIVAVSSESYTNHADASAAAHSAFGTVGVHYEDSET